MPQNSSVCVKACEEVLLSTYALFMNTQFVHWNVRGPNFFSIHKLTEEHYTNLFEAIDAIAEHVRTLGSNVLFSPTQILKQSAVKLISYPEPSLYLMRSLRDAHEGMLALISASMKTFSGNSGNSDDMVTEALFADRLAWHKKAHWMYTSHCENEDPHPHRQGPKLRTTSNSDAVL